jgi:uncharacterized protein YdbL (DUF1318 family)
MNLNKNFIAAAIYLLVLFIGSSLLLAEDTMDDIKDRMKERYPKLKELKEEKKLGETQQGFVEIIIEDSSEVARIQKFAEAENADREKLYDLIAKSTQTTAEVVGKNNAIRIFKKAGDEELFKGPDGKWYQKKDIEKETENGRKKE